MRAWISPVFALTVLVSCTEPTRTFATAPGNSVGGASALTDAVKSWEANSAIYWNEVARNLVAANRTTAPVALRVYAIVSVAQYNAAVTAEKGKDGSDHPSVRAAIAAASVVTLSYLYPSQTASLEARLHEFLSAPRWPGYRNVDMSTGEAIGRGVGQQVVVRAQGDNFFATGPVSVPVGPGLWFSATPPVGAFWGQAKTFLLLSGNQFRPPPPPLFGSDEFNTALAEVRQISDTRTPEQDAIAKFWDFPVGTSAAAGYWNAEGARLAVRYRLGDLEAAHVFALENMAGFDGLVASHDGKYFYWMLRPNMADPLITLAIPQPNFPSYPSNHAVISAAMARILGEMFPAERSRLDALAEEAAISRIFGGIHYRFDANAGLVLGRTVAVWALDHDVAGHEPFVLR
jgi:membrane-associated phospholipid phosphatase